MGTFGASLEESNMRTATLEEILEFDKANWRLRPVPLDRALKYLSNAYLFAQNGVPRKKLCPKYEENSNLPNGGSDGPGPANDVPYTGDEGSRKPVSVRGP